MYIIHRKRKKDYFTGFKSYSPKFGGTAFIYEDLDEVQQALIDINNVIVRTDREEWGLEILELSPRVYDPNISDSGKSAGVTYREVYLALGKGEFWGKILPEGTQIKMYPNGDKSYWSDTNYFGEKVAGSYVDSTNSGVTVRIPVSDVCPKLI